MIFYFYVYIYIFKFDCVNTFSVLVCQFMVKIESTIMQDKLCSMMFKPPHLDLIFQMPAG